MRHLLPIAFSVIAALSVFEPIAIGATLNAGDILEVHFTIPTPSCAPFGACDVLGFSPHEFGAFFATNVTAQLFNGSTNLGGTYFSTSCCSPDFHAAGSLWTNGAVADFTAIDAGTVDGIIRMSIGTGSLTWPSTPDPTFVLGHGTGPGSSASAIDNPINVTSVSIFTPTPEPSTAAISLAGLLFLYFRYRIRARTEARL